MDVLTSERLAEALDFSGVTVKEGEPRVPQIRSIANAVMRYLVPSTLPAHDQAGALLRGYFAEYATIDSMQRADDFSWHPTACSGMRMQQVGAAMQEIAMSRAIAKLGSPAVTPTMPRNLAPTEASLASAVGSAHGNPFGDVADFLAAAVAVAQALDDGGSLGPDGEERDPRAWVMFARGLADRVGSRVEQAVSSADNLEAAHERIAELEARPVLTVEALAAELAVNFSFDDGRHAKGPAKRILDALGLVTLPTPDQTAELAQEIHRARLARLGKEANSIGIPAVDDIRTALKELRARGQRRPA